MKEKAAKSQTAPIRLGKFNVVDIAAVILILVVAAFVIAKIAFDRDEVEEIPVTMTITAMVEGAAADIYESVQPYLPSTLMASGQLLDGEIVSVEKRPHLTAGPDGIWMEDPNHVDLFFTVINHTTQSGVLMSKVGEQEVRIGRRDYTLKSEYIEFHNVSIVNVQWDYPDGAPEAAPEADS